LRAGTAAWYRQKGPVFQFVLVFGLLLGVFYAATLSSFFHRTLFPATMRLNARLSAPLLNALGQATTVSGSSIASARFSIDVARGCDAVEPAALFAAAVLAFPAPWRRKWPGLALGVLLLFALNLGRIVSLFLVGVYWPRLFHSLHADVWQVVFIVLAIVCWAGWIQWALARRAAAPHVAA
jgi:exosortase H (IPTLxxWG-CTERM-specific)